MDRGELEDEGTVPNEVEDDQVSPTRNNSGYNTRQGTAGREQCGFAAQ